jgi:hypothetical protein
MRCASDRKLSRILVPNTGENVVRQSIVDAYQSRPRCRFTCIAHVTVRRRSVDPRQQQLFPAFGTVHIARPQLGRQTITFLCALV